MPVLSVCGFVPSLSCVLLLIRTLIQKLEDGKATSTDIGSAVKVLVSNRVQPGDAQDVHQSFTTQGTYPFSPLDFPISI